MADQDQRISQLKQRIASLSPEKRALFERQLQQRNLQINPQNNSEINSQRQKLTIPRCSNYTDLPLSFAQERLWFAHQIDPNNPAYNIAIVWHFTGSLNYVALKQSLNEIVDRHDSLRTAFSSESGNPRQHILENVQFPLPVVDLRQLTEQDQSAEIERLSQAEVDRPFDLTQVPLLRSTLLQIQDDEAILLLTLHHSIADGWSRGILLRELAPLYRAFAAGHPSPLAELPIQYADFAIWQRQQLQGAELAALQSYWRQQLRDLTPLELPCDRPRSATLTLRSATCSVELPPALLPALKQLSRESGVTLFTTLLAAFKLLLHRYSGQDDIAVGAPIANRNWAETEGLIGFFVNTLVLRTDLSGNPSFRDLLQQVQSVTAGAFQHQDLPFALLIDAIKPQRSLSHNPLFQVMFQFQNEAYQHQNALAPNLAIPGLKLTQQWAAPSTTKFDLTWHVIERQAGLLVVVEYCTELFDRDRIDRMLKHFQMLLQGIVHYPEQHLSELPILTLTEQQQLFVDWNQTSLSDFPKLLIHQQFEVQAQLTPNHIAVVFEDQKLTCQELNEKANQLAHYLRSLNVQAETLVGLCMNRSPELLIGLLAILKAGAAYVPLDPQLPSDRLAFMLEDSQVQVLLTKESLSFPVPATQTLDLHTDWETIAQFPETNPGISVHAENLAYVIYTSGSTGTPKGTMLTHRGLINYLNWCVEAYAVAEGSGAPVQSSIGFDATITSLLAPLMVGRSVSLLPENQEIEALTAVLNTPDTFSLVKLTPAHLNILSQLLPLQNYSLQDHPVGTKTFVIGGEALSEQHLNFWRTHAPHVRLMNEYGPTETVVGCCVYHVPDCPNSSSTIPIGRPIANTQLYILDRYLQMVPIGVPGELHIGGAGVARGYLDRPDLTAEKFIPNPFLDTKNSAISNSLTLYKTGDRACYLPDGTIEYLGRLDHQVKLRGFRIELGEIEAVLAQYPHVQQAVVIVQDDAVRGQQLVAYVVLKESGAKSQELESENHPLTSQTLRNFLKAKLPDYMVPAAFVMVSSLPLTANGKVNYKALPKLDEVDRETFVLWTVRSTIAPSTYAAPRTANEVKLAEIWADLLGVQVGIHDNFFELGGDSILSIQIVARANQAGLKLTPRQLFEYQTIAELAAVATPLSSTPVQQGIVTGDVPLTPIQHWFFEQALPQPHHFNQAVLLEVPAGLQPTLLRQSLQQLLKHHDALRLRFTLNQGQWQQVNASPDEIIPFSVIDLSRLSEIGQCSMLETAANQLQSSLDLSSQLVQSALFQFGAGQSDRLLLIIHHLVIDAVSWRILLEDLFTVYQQLEQQQAIQLPPKTTAFREWAVNLISYANSGSLSQELPYWLNLAQSTASLPVDQPQGQDCNTEASVAQVSTALTPEMTHALEKFSQTYHVQLYEVLLTALVQTLNQWQRSYNHSSFSSILIDLEGHGREFWEEVVDVSRTIGWFTNIFPVQFSLESALHSIEALKSIKEQLRQVPNRGIGYGIAKYLHPDRTVRSRLQAISPAVKFNYLGELRIPNHPLVLGLATESSGSPRSPLGNRRYLLEVNSFIADGQLTLHWNYSHQVHQSGTIQQTAQSFQAALKALMQQGKSPIANVHTPSDFAAARLNQDQLDQVLSKIQRSGRR